jgi:hypothetical protein
MFLTADFVKAFASLREDDFLLPELFLFFTSLTASCMSTTVVESRRKRIVGILRKKNVSDERQ